MKVIFLDFDGVLDTAYYESYLEQRGHPSCDEDGRPIFDPMCVGYLKRIIEKTNTKLVVSSDWKYYDSLKELQNLWVNRQMPGRLLDITPNNKICRGAEISEWLSKKEDITNYVILDDLSADNFHADQLEHLVAVNPYNGIDEVVCGRVINILDR